MVQCEYNVEIVLTLINKLKLPKEMENKTLTSEEISGIRNDEEYEETSLQDIGGYRVHWDDDGEYISGYDSEMQSNYTRDLSASASAKGQSYSASTIGRTLSASTRGHLFSASTMGRLMSATTRGRSLSASTMGRSAVTSDYTLSASTKRYSLSASTKGRLTSASTMDPSFSGTSMGHITSTYIRQHSASTSTRGCSISASTRSRVFSGKLRGQLTPMMSMNEESLFDEDSLTGFGEEVQFMEEEDEDEEAGSRAPSVSLWYNDDEPGDILTQDVYVPTLGLAKHTYYCCLQWNAGMNGGGYCGIQDHPRGRNYIFSVWDPIDVKDSIVPAFTDPGTICEPFGNEGTGLKCWNFDLGWEPDKWYTLLIRRWEHNDHTFFGFWVRYHIENIWTQIVTLDFPVGSVYFKTVSCSFLEDWEGTGDQERRVHYKNGYKRALNGKWIPFDTAVFSKVTEAASKLYENNFDGGTLDETFFLHCGGKTMTSEKTKEEPVFKRIMPPKPNVLPICCYITLVTMEEVIWEIPSGSTPQFQYIVYIDGEIYQQEINSEIRMVKLKKPAKDMVELLVEDIYGNIVRSKFKIDIRELEPNPTPFVIQIPSATDIEIASAAQNI